MEILPPDINASEIRCWGRGKKVRLGFMLIKGLSQRAMEVLIEKRRSEGAYLNFDDFRRRANLDPSDARLLIKAGAFDALEGKTSRAGLMWKLALPAAVRPALKDGATNCSSPLKRARRIKNESKLPLFDDGQIRMPSVPPYDERTLLQHEKEIYGFLVSRHPLELYQERLQKLNLVRSCDLPKHVGKTVQGVGWLITGKIVSTKQKELMEFLTFEDQDAVIETVFFPKTYDRYCHMLSRERPFLLRGKVEEDFGAVTMTVEEVKYI